MLSDEGSCTLCQEMRVGSCGGEDGRGCPTADTDRSEESGRTRRRSRTVPGLPMALRVVAAVMAAACVAAPCLASSLPQHQGTCDSPTKLTASELKIRYYQDNLSTPGFFRYMTIDKESGYIFVGGVNALHALHLYNIENKNRNFKQEFNADPEANFLCKSQETQSEYQSFLCQNNIRLLLRNRTLDNVFYMCGTGSYKPTGYQLKLENKKFRILKRDDALGICPFDPRDNTTALIVEHGNPGGVPALYSGGITDLKKSDPIIFRPDIYKNDFSLAAHFVRTLRQKTNWLNEPQFVGSFDLNGQVYFFFRENALEHSNCGKKIYSRVVRICKNDLGGRFILKNRWTSFIKARLNCSLPGEFPYYFDEIQDIQLIGNTFYGLFTTNVNGITASAVCAYTVDDMNRAFNGRFKSQENINSNWRPVPESEVPDPRPGNCTVRDTQELSTKALNFISQTTPLMDKAVEHQYGQPIFYQGNCLLQKLNVIQNVSGNKDIVFFAASNSGFVYKIFAWPSRRRSEPPKSYISTTYVPFEDSRPIWSMLLSQTTLFLATDKSIAQMSVITCEAYNKVDLCVYDPFCGWDPKANECVTTTKNPRIITYADLDIVTHGLERAIQIRVGDLYEFSKVSKISGSSVTLKVNYKLYFSGATTWTRNTSSSNLMDDRHILAHDNSLIITDLRKADEGVYEAFDEHKRPVAKYQLSIETTKEQIEQRWMRKFDQWCDEFERYQNDIRQWEQKCSTCCDESPISNMVPGIGGGK